MEMDAVTSLVNPISTDLPTGEDLSYDDAFERIENEVNKATNMFATEVTDWQIVADTSLELLQNQTKDLRLALWLCRAQLEQAPTLDTLDFALKLYTGLIETFGKDLYPSRVRAQIANLEQFNQLLEKHTSKVSTQASEQDLEKLITDIRALDQTLELNFPDDSPNFLPLIRGAEEQKKRQLAEQETKAKQAQTSKPSVMEKAKAVASHILQLDGNIQSERDAAKALRQLQDFSRNLASYWLSQNLNDTRPYSLNRATTWLGILQLPGADQDGNTQLKPLLAAKIQEYDSMLAEKRYADLLHHLETSLTKAPFWLDGHHMVYQCLKGLNHEEAASAVCDALGPFLRDYPELLEMQFDDHSPFANDATRLWLEHEVLTSASDAQTEFHQATQDDLLPAWEEALIAAKAQLKTANLAHAIEPLHQGQRHANSNRDKFFWALAQARLFQHTRNFDLACALLANLDQQLQTDGIASWEPELAETTLLLWYQCQEKLPTKDQDKALLARLRERLCCLNPKLVLSE